MTNEQIQALNQVCGLLRAMASNYSAGHCWDHLDGEAVSIAADGIGALLAEREADKALISELHKAKEDETMRANREHHRGFMMACGHLKEHENVHYADAAEMEISALRQRIAELEARTLTVKLPKLKMLEDYLAEVAEEERRQIIIGAKLEFHRICKEACAAAGITLVVGE